MQGYLSEKFQIKRSSNFGDTIEDTVETITSISTEEIGKLGISILGVSLHYFQKRSTLDTSPGRGISFYPIRILKFEIYPLLQFWGGYQSKHGITKNFHFYGNP